LLLLASCSFNKNSGFWSGAKTIKKENVINTTEIFKEKKAYEKEINPNLKIQLSLKPKSNNFINNLNNSGHVDYNGELKKTSRFKYSKIKDFHQYEPDLIFDKNNIIFFDDKGSILKFNNYSELIWKKNYYSKKEKKKKPFLFFAKNSNILIVADTISKYYAIDISTGNLLWSKFNSVPFNSEIKLYKDRFFVVDFENIIRCYSIKDGKQIWKFKTEKAIIKSQKKLSIIIIKDTVYFSNSIGDITAIKAKNGDLIWQTPTQKSAIIAGHFLSKTSDLVSDNNSIFFSNNNNEFFSLDSKAGIINWKQNINSTLRPTLINNLIFTISNEGFLVVIDKNTGSILKMTNVFDIFRKKKRSRIKPEGFIIGNKKIYLTTNNGRLLIIDISSGKTSNVLKIDGDRISKPFILGKSMFIIKNNAIIKLN